MTKPFLTSLLVSSASPDSFDLNNSTKSTEQEITGEVLLRLDTDMLKNEIGIRALGKRLRVASSITDLRQCPISSPSNSSITKTPLPPSSFRHASSSSLNLLSRKQHHSQSYHSLPEILDNYSSWKFPADLFDGPSAEIGSSSTHGSGIGLEIPFTINEDVPMSFETSSSLSHGHSSCNRAVSHNFFLFLVDSFADISVYGRADITRRHLGRSGIVVRGTL